MSVVVSMLLCIFVLVTKYEEGELVIGGHMIHQRVASRRKRGRRKR